MNCIQFLKKALKLTQQFQSKLSELETKAVKSLIAATFGELKNKYKFKKVRKYLDKAAEHVLENLDQFKFESVDTKRKRK